MNPQFPIYIVSKGRWESRLTSKALETMHVPYHIIVEEQEFTNYAAVIDKKKILVLDRVYQDKYDPCDSLGATVSKGSGAARNFAWDHAVARNKKWHWVLDDNITDFRRILRQVYLVDDGTIFRCAEEFCSRYENIALAGFNHDYFPRSKVTPIEINVRAYSTILIRNDIRFRWRGRFNEDTDLSLRALKAGWCTILFNAFLQAKAATLTMKGGNTEELYSSGARKLEKSRMIANLHPDVARLSWRYGRWHHYINYAAFKHRLILRPGVRGRSRAINNYGLKLVPRAQEKTGGNSLPPV